MRAHNRLQKLEAARINPLAVFLTEEHFHDDGEERWLSGVTILNESIEKRFERMKDEPLGEFRDRVQSSAAEISGAKYTVLLPPYVDKL